MREGLFSLNQLMLIACTLDHNHVLITIGDMYNRYNLRHLPAMAEDHPNVWHRRHDGECAMKTTPIPGTEDPYLKQRMHIFTLSSILYCEGDVT